LLFFFVIAGQKARSAVLRKMSGNPCGREARSSLPQGFAEPQVGMDHRVKPGGDEVSAAW
jgi:hypothetical protein